MPNEDPVTETAKATQEVARTVGKGIDAADKVGSFIGRYIAGSTEQAFGLLEDHLRFTRWERRVRYVERAQDIAKRAKITLKPDSIPLNVAAHLLLEGSLEEDNDLQDRYAALLVNAANADGSVEVRRMHVDILSQLGPLEITILDALYEGKDVPGTDNGVLGAFLPDRIETSKTFNTNNLSPFPQPPEEIQVPLLNLIRLGCVVSTSASSAPMQMTNWVAITALGRNFVRACKVE